MASGTPRFATQTMPGRAYTTALPSARSVIAAPDETISNASSAVAAVGVCMGGGYAVSTAARDKRVRAVVSIAGGYNIGGTFQQMLGVDGFAALAVYEAAIGPKELVWIDADNHIQLYDQDPYVSEAAKHAIRWLDRHLRR